MNRVETVCQYDDVNQRLDGIDTNTPFGEIQHLRDSYTAHGLVSQVTNAVSADPTRGPSTMTIANDELEPLRQSDGLFTYKDGAQRRFSLEMTYDVGGRTTRMNQRDELRGGAPVASSSRSSRRSSVNSAARLETAHENAPPANRR